MTVPDSDPSVEAVAAALRGLRVARSAVDGLRSGDALASIGSVAEALVADFGRGGVSLRSNFRVVPAREGRALGFLDLAWDGTDVFLVRARFRAVAAVRGGVGVFRETPVPQNFGLWCPRSDRADGVLDDPVELGVRAWLLAEIAAWTHRACAREGSAWTLGLLPPY